MAIDLHIHSRSSDGALSVEQIFREAEKRRITFLSITDHDSIGCQDVAVDLSENAKIGYVTGVELNVTFSHQGYREGKPISLDFLGYQFDPTNDEMKIKLQQMAAYREKRGVKILENLNAEFGKEGITALSKEDFEEMQASVDGTFGRPHIADYLVKRGLVKTRQEAFDKYLVKCNVPKFPLHLEEASRLVRRAGGKLVLAHPNDPHGTSLVTLTKSLTDQAVIIESSMLSFIDGVECWHSRNNAQTTQHYISFAKAHGLIMTGGSDCHQKPIVMGSVDIPEFVARQF